MYVSFVDSEKFATENEGNYLQCFELQTVGKEMLRKSLVSIPSTFFQKCVNFEKFCKYKKFLHSKYGNLNLIHFTYVLFPTFIFYA